VARLYGCVLALAALTACGTSEGGFLEDYTRVSCDRAKDCYPDDFETVYGTEADCRDEFAEFFDEDAFADCEFDRGEANDCLDAVRGASCEEIESGDAWSACDGVYTECAG
jgi:hypothetical protein